MSDPDPAGGPRRAALLICLIAGFLTLLDVSAVTVALPAMEHRLQLGPAEVSWAVAGYALAFGLTLVPAGRLGDEYGRRRLFLVGLALFALTGLLCGAAPDGVVLIAGRLLRGVAAGVLAPQVIGLLQQMYRGPRRGRAFGYYGATVGLSTAVGPVLGGAILLAFGPAEGWRYLFYLSVPVVVLAWVAGWKVLPPDRRGRAHRLDLVGALLLGLSVLAVMLPLLQTTGTNTRPQYWLLAAGAALLVLFVLWERRLATRDARPLVHLKVLRIRSYAVGTLVATAFYSGFTGIFLVLSLFLQQGLHYSAWRAALSTVLFTVASAALAVVSGRLVHRFGRYLVAVGTALATAGLTTLALVAHTVTPADAAVLLAAPLVLTGAGCGLVISANQTLALTDITPATAGVAAGIYETGQRIGTALGTALVSALFFGTLAHTHGDYHAAVAAGLTGPAVLVGLACAVSLVDLLRPIRAVDQTSRPAPARPE